MTTRRASVAPSHTPAIELDDLPRRYLILNGHVRKLSMLLPHECELLVRQCVPDGKSRSALTYRIGEWDWYAIWYVVDYILSTPSTRGNLVLYYSREAAEQARQKE